MGILSFFQNNSSKMDAQEMFNKWLIRILQTEKPDSEIIAFNFGIFQTENGFSLYLSGAKNYDAENDDWAIGFGDFSPKDKYLELPIDKTQHWEKTQKQVVELIKNFMNLEIFNGSFLDKSKAITTGFDDGDLIKIK